MNQTIEEKIEVLIKEMTLREKVGQLTQKVLKIENSVEVKEYVKNGDVGSLILATSAHAGNDKQQKLVVEFLNDIQKVAVEESKMKIPIIFGRDVIHGHNTVYPIPLAMAASFNMPLIKESYECVAKEASNDGIHWSFAPMLDVSRDSRWGRCIESPGEDPYLGMQVAKAVVEGFQGDDHSKQESIAACAKHYIGYGASEGGRDYHKAEISDYTLRNYYLKAFKSAVDNGVATVMNSFNEISGQTTTSSKYLLKDVLKDELGFNGFIISDWAAIAQLERQGVAENRKECAKLAINAGLDMDMVDDCYIDYLEELVAENEVLIETIDESVRRILRIKLEYGLFEHPYTVIDEVNKDDHMRVAKEIALESMVLLKNKDNVLPLKKDAKIALIGPMVDEKRSHMGSWTLDGIEEDVLTIREGINKIAPNAVIYSADGMLYDDMIMQIRHCDVVVLALGESHKVTGECHSLCDINLPEEQLNLAKRAFEMGKPVVGVFCFGRTIAFQSAEPYLCSILYSWHSGSRAGEAIADILFGNVSPSGKLPMTMPRHTGQVPLYYNAPSSGRAVNGYYGEGLFYNYDDCLSTPLYPFGFGLGYSKFEYTDIKTDIVTISNEDIENGKSFTISVNVKNVGDYDAKEVVQLYIRDKVATMTRPIRELKGFEKKLIKKGDSELFEFTLGKEELGYYNGTEKFLVEKGEFEVYIGSDCYANNSISIFVI